MVQDNVWETEKIHVVWSCKLKTLAAIPSACVTVLSPPPWLLGEWQYLLLFLMLQLTHMSTTHITIVDHAYTYINGVVAGNYLLSKPHKKFTAWCRALLARMDVFNYNDLLSLSPCYVMTCCDRIKFVHHIQSTIVDHPWDLMYGSHWGNQSTFHSVPHLLFQTCIGKNSIVKLLPVQSSTLVSQCAL